jgi:hypothetical protein
MPISRTEDSATQAVLTWLGEHGVDTSHPEVRREAQAVTEPLLTSDGVFTFSGAGVTIQSSSTSSFSIRSGMSRMRTDPFSSTSTGASTRPVAEPYRRHLMAAGAGAVWLAGLALLLLWLKLRHVGKPLQAQELVHRPALSTYPESPDQRSSVGA